MEVTICLGVRETDSGDLAESRVEQTRQIFDVSPQLILIGDILKPRFAILVNCFMHSRADFNARRKWKSGTHLLLSFFHGLLLVKKDLSTNQRDVEGD